MSFAKTEFHQTPAGKIAYRKTGGKSGKTGIVWCGGLRSDMMGGKATELHQAAMGADRTYLRFDYTGHGESEVAFEATTIADWKRDALVAVDELIDGPIIMVGSSMGGWTSLMATMERPERVKGLVLIAPAPDFTEKLMWAGFSDDIKHQIESQGYWMRPSEYEEDYPITKELIEAGRNLQITDNPIDLNNIPVRIIQGVLDDAVPWNYAQSLVDIISSEDVSFHLVKDGDHRMSRPQDVAHIIHTVLALADQLDASASA